VTAAVVAAVALVAFGLLAWAHRSGRTRALGRLAGFSQRVSGMERWAALPAAIVGVSLVTAVTGFYWDVSTHIDNGRDPGPFANPSHYLILVGLAGIALAGGLAVLLGCDEDDVGSSVRLRDGWHVPVGAVLVTLCGVVALAGFPLDDVWHRLFGQDVTLWGPTHVQMVGGASLSTLVLWILLTESARARRRRGRPPLAARVRRLADVPLGGAFLIGLSTLQAEFDFGVPQFRLLFQPVMIALAAGIGLVTARIRIGPGGAVSATGFYLALRGALTLVIGPGLGRIVLHFPLYVVEAALVELVALRVPAHRQLSLGAASGLLIGTVGVTAEWVWSQLWMPLAWNTALLPELALLAPLAGVAGGVLGGFAGRALAPEDQSRQPVPGWVAPATAAAAVAVLAWPMPMRPASDLTVTVDLEEVAAQPGRAVEATLALHPPDAAAGAEWLTVTAWQGADWQDRQSVVDPLERVAPGVYRTTRPIPVHGDWKALVRLHRGRIMAAAPIYLPHDEAIDAPEVPARDGVTRGFVYGKTLLQREARDAPRYLWNTGYAIIAAIVGGWIAALAWGLRRLRASRPADGRPGDRPRRHRAALPARPAARRGGAA
jgi:hypothetical protein